MFCIIFAAKKLKTGIMETPFIFGKIATEKNFTDREMETANLVQN